MDSWQQIGRRPRLTSKKGDPMAVALLFQGLVAQPRVSMHDAARFDGVLHKRHQAFSRGVRDTPHADPADTPAIFLRRNHDQRLLLRLPTAHTFFYTTEICLVHLHRSRE